MSNSTSNSSSSPPEPTTPPQTNRYRTRYPDLGRVPLHRRGTSKTYERLEDLLKEAGYKETRIFTPEAERAEANEGSGDKRNSVVKGGVGSVVGFLTNLMPGVTGSRTHIPSTTEEAAQYTTSPLECSPPVSPLAQRRPPRSATTRTSFDATEPPTPTNLTSSVDSLADPTPKAIRQQSSGQRPSLAHRTSSQLSYGSSWLQKQPSRTSLNGSDTNTIASPRPSHAGAYLRHMASRASMQSVPPRPKSTPVGLFNQPKLRNTDSDSEGPPSTLSRQGNGEGEDSQPPLPPSWLESVARAVLFGGTGAYIGGPSNHPTPEQHLRSQTLRPTRSSLSQKHPDSRSSLFDQTNHLIVPPPLLSKLKRGRSRETVGEVSLTRVVCRSAPGSRSGSLVRDHGKEKRRGFARRRKETDRVPSLARTHVEGDVWASSARRKSNSRNHPSTSNNENRYLSGWGVDAESGEEHTGPGSTSEEDDDDDDDELDLARILVPPKRQNSIKSLRKHLAAEGVADPGAHATLMKLSTNSDDPGNRAGNATGSVVTPRVDRGYSVSSVARKPKALIDDDWDGGETQEWGGGWVKKRGGGRGSDDDDIDSFAGFFGEGREVFGSGKSRRSATGKSRLGFNGAWGLMGGTGSGS